MSMRWTLAGVAAGCTVACGAIGCSSTPVVTITPAPAVAPGADKRLVVFESCYAPKNTPWQTVHIYVGYDANGLRPTQECDEKFYVPAACTFQNTWLSPTEVKVAMQPVSPPLPPATQPDAAYATRRYRYDVGQSLVYRVQSKGEVALKRQYR